MALLLEPALGSAFQTQVVLAQFTEQGIASLVQDAKKLERSNDPSRVAAAAAKLHGGMLTLDTSDDGFCVRLTLVALD